jgi:hypothetical protein
MGCQRLKRRAGPVVTSAMRRVSSIPFALCFVAALLGATHEARAQQAASESMQAEPRPPDTQLAGGLYFVTALDTLPGIATGGGVAGLWSRRWFVLRADLRLVGNPGDIDSYSERVRALAFTSGLAGLAQFEWLRFGAYVRGGRLWAHTSPTSPDRKVSEPLVGFGPTMEFVVRATPRVHLSLGLEVYVPLVSAHVRVGRTGDAWLEPDAAFALTVGGTFGGGQP